MAVMYNPRIRAVMYAHHAFLSQAFRETLSRGKHMLDGIYQDDVTWMRRLHQITPYMSVVWHEEKASWHMRLHVKRYTPY